MATASKTSSLPTLAKTTYRSCWAMAMALSALPQTSVAGDGPVSVAVGDFNGDGKQDLAVCNAINIYLGALSILLGDGTGNFSAPTTFAVGAGPLEVAVGDFNGDGKQDLAVANYANGSHQNGTLSILLGDGAGNFTAPTNFHASFPNSVAVGDFNGDGKQDLAVGNSLPGCGIDLVRRRRRGISALPQALPLAIFLTQ